MASPKFLSPFGLCAAVSSADAEALARSDAPVLVRSVLGKRDLEWFVRMPWLLYRDDPNWVPPLLIDVKEFLDPHRHPFYRHGAATQFLAFREGVPVGRILVSDDPRFNAKHGTNLGCFGMFESVDDHRVAHALFEAAAGWLRSRGRDEMMGPIDYSINYPCGLLIEGFNHPPRVMMNHNPPYYVDLLQSWGLEKKKDLYAWWFVGTGQELPRWEKRVERLLTRSGITIRPFCRKDFDSEVDRCQRIYAATRYDQWGFVELTNDEFRYFGKRLAQFADPNMVLIAEREGQPVGFAITVPDLNEAIRPLNGRLTCYGVPLGLARLLFRLRRVTTARMMVLGVIEGVRRRGVAELLIMRTLNYGRNRLHYKAAELSWTLEDNHAINHTIEHVGGKRYKTYRIYSRKIA